MDKKIKTCKQDCRENKNGYCQLKGKPSDYSKIKLGSECEYYRRKR